MSVCVYVCVCFLVPVPGADISDRRFCRLSVLFYRRVSFSPFFFVRLAYVTQSAPRPTTPPPPTSDNLTVVAICTQIKK